MRHIRKGPEPQSLLAYRQTEGASYDGLPQEAKDDIRAQLAREQGFLCCYCMQRITPDLHGMKIEHWAPQGDPATRHRQLDWKNLLGACRGNEGQPLRAQHCDTRKGDIPLTVNPSDERCEQLVRFLADGSIESGTPAVNDDLNQTLNLNYALLRNNRKAALAGFLEAMRRKFPQLTWTDASLERALAELQQPNARGQLQPYCQVLIYWLKKRMGLLPKAHRA
ncbi:retron system putative HNH endonuclease [Hyalangium gracile]|uniref:retron system putative HNH endonuclease n=1 Tax=Hyalangium gracile TaxID=394092 RepID=UPI001CCB12CF|nr:retron system putative HNH endonuclease [Hyalangium gracile]